MKVDVCAAVCDVLIAARGVQFCPSEAGLGLLPAAIGPYVVRVLGEQASRRFFVTAGRFDADTAPRLGFVHEVEVVETDALDAKVAEITRAPAAYGPAALRACKRLIEGVAAAPITPQLCGYTARRIIRASTEGHEGVASFLGRREPAWRGGGDRKDSRSNGAAGSGGSGAAS